MKRFHVHLSVAELEPSVAFYTRLFGVDPTVLKPDYAKWMLEDPRINFAMSTTGSGKGVEHLGLQVDSDEELAALRRSMQSADAGLMDEANANCCYARSDKHWATDPQGIAWEGFRSLGELQMYGDDFGPATGRGERKAATAGCCGT